MGLNRLGLGSQKSQVKLVEKGEPLGAPVWKKLSRSRIG